MSLSPILSVVHTVAIGTMLNFNGGTKRHRLRILNVNRPLIIMNILVIGWFPIHTIFFIQIHDVGTAVVCHHHRLKCVSLQRIRQLL